MVTRQQRTLQEICADILQQLHADPNLFQNIITSDETWIFQYDPQAKRQLMSGLENAVLNKNEKIHQSNIPK